MHNKRPNITFPLIAKFEMVRTFLSLAAQLKQLVYKFKIKLAFLNGELEQKVYVIQPASFIIKSKEDYMYELRKALYGLKQVSLE